MNARQRLFHIVSSAVWSALTPAGDYRPASLADEGFVHLSYADQVLGTANRFYRDLADPVAVEFARAALGATVVDEDSYGPGQRSRTCTRLSRSRPRWPSIPFCAARTADTAGTSGTG